jgi:hypothetical protein
MYIPANLQVTVLPSALPQTQTTSLSPTKSDGTYLCTAELKAEFMDMFPEVKNVTCEVPPDYIDACISQYEQDPNVVLFNVPKDADETKLLEAKEKNLRKLAVCAMKRADQLSQEALKCSKRDGKLKGKESDGYINNPIIVTDFDFEVSLVHAKIHREPNVKNEGGSGTSSRDIRRMVPRQWLLLQVQAKRLQTQLHPGQIVRLRQSGWCGVPWR